MDRIFGMKIERVNSANQAWGQILLYLYVFDPMSDANKYMIYCFFNYRSEKHYILNEERLENMTWYEMFTKASSISILHMTSTS